MGKAFSAALFFWATLICHAKPIIQGYERFHAQSPSVEGGAVLYSELGCANCHSTASPIPERKGPVLTNVSKRLNRDWVRSFLENPEKAQPGTTMPHVLDTIPEESHKVATDDILAWLKSLETKTNFNPPRHGNAANGKQLFENKGCAACHTDGSKLPDFPAKTSYSVLNSILGKLDNYRTDGRMPHFPLNQYESADIAAYLFKLEGSDPRLTPSLPSWPKGTPEQVTRGKALAGALGCANCHDLKGVDKLDKSPLLNSETPIQNLAKPHLQYKLDDNQRNSIAAFLSSAPLKASPEITMTALNCYACHSRDGKGGPKNETNAFFEGDSGLGDSGRIPPPLSGIGHKLQPEWMEKIFHGENKVRPYLKTQMPHYKSQAKFLTQMFQDADAKASNPLAKETDSGYKLLGVRGGYNCITCHNWGDRKSLGIQALDIKSSTRRLRPEWFREYLINPAGYRPGTLMPAFWPNGKASIQDIHGGDTEKQIAAIWHAIKESKALPEGFPDQTSQRYELIPKDQPIVQRAFFRGIGTKAIMVGFPGGINLGYDSANAQPKLLWRGRFMDAYNTWFVRKFPFEVPMEKRVHHFPHAKGGHYKGFELEEDGFVTFLAQDYQESFGSKDGQLLRIVRPANTLVTHPEGVAREAKPKGESMVYVYFTK